MAQAWERSVPAPIPESELVGKGERERGRRTAGRAIEIRDSRLEIGGRAAALCISLLPLRGSSGEAGEGGRVDPGKRAWPERATRSAQAGSSSGEAGEGAEGENRKWRMENSGKRGRALYHSAPPPGELSPKATEGAASIQGSEHGPNGPRAALKLAGTVADSVTTRIRSNHHLLLTSLLIS